MIARTSALLLLGALSSVALANASASSDPYEPAQVKVRYDDLDLSSENGALTLYQRITTAARQVCPTAIGLSLKENHIRNSCISSAVERAVAEVNSPTLAKVGAARSRRLAQG
jgi:UrcA family protein